MRRRILPVHKPGAAPQAESPQAGTPARAPSLQLPSGIGQNVEVDPLGVNGQPTTDRFSEPSVAIDPNDTTNQKLAASSNFLTGSSHVDFTSVDGGTGWAKGNLPVTSSLTPARFDDPGVTYDFGQAQFNHVFYSILGIDRLGNTDLEVVRTNEDGSQSLGTVLDTATNEPDKPMIASDPRAQNQSVYVGYDTNPAAANSGQPLKVVASHNSASSWGTPVPVWNSGGDIGAWPTVGPDGTVYLVWDDYCGGTPSTLPTLATCPKPGGQILFSKSTDGGATWLTTPTPAHVSDTTTGFGSILPNYATECTAGCPARPVGPFPQIAIDRSGGVRNGTLYVVYGDGSDRQLGASTVPSAHRMHVFLQESKDGGTTWSSRIQIDIGNTSNDSWQPTVAVDQSNGNVVVAWYDRRDDVNNKLYRPYFTESLSDSNGVAQFTPQLPLADVQSDPSVDCNGSGDYFQIAAQGGKAHPVWTDSRFGLPKVFTTTVDEATAASSTSTAGGANGTLRNPDGTSWLTLPGGATDIGVGADCQAWIIGEDAIQGGDGTWAWTGFAGGWISGGGGGVRIAVAPDGLPVMVNSSNEIWFARAFRSWAQLPGGGVDIGVGPDFSLWLIGEDNIPSGHSVYFFNGTGWTYANGGGTRIAVGPDGLPWILNSSGQIWHLTSSGWQQVPGGGNAIAVGADGSVWLLGLNPIGGGFQTYRFNGTGWDAVNGGGVEIAVGPDGMPWLVNSSGQIYERT